MTHWIGLTGGIGSGKSAATDFFMKLGIQVIDADAISRQLTAKNGEALPLISKQFGEQAVVDEQLNRDYMRHLVFSQPTAKTQLEAILHPLILSSIEKQKQQNDACYGLIDVPLLTELPAFQQLVERILLIDCPEETQISRVIARSGLSREQITAIMAQQATRAERLAIADDVICNDASIEDLQIKVLQCHHHYLQLFDTV